MDAARSLWRLGKEVKVMYRRTRIEMPAIAEEIDELILEGIPIEFLATPVEVLHDAASGRLIGAKCIRMQLGKPDESGRRKPEPIPGSDFVEICDSIITAIGETADLSYLPLDFLAKTSWNIPADELGRTFEPKFFAGGDVADGAGTVTAAIGFGRRAAIAIDALLKGNSAVDSLQTTANGKGNSAVDSPQSTANSSLIPHPSSLIPHPSSLIPHPSSLIHHPSSLIPFRRRRSPVLAKPREACRPFRRP